MPSTKRLASTLLFAGGLVIVFTGLSAALDFTLIGILASIAVVSALLYAGGVWFGAKEMAAPTVIVFDRELRVVAGRRAGEPIARQFPEPFRAEIERRCALAIAGQHSHFVCDDRHFDAAPVLASQSSTICGVLVEGASVVMERAAVDAAAIGVA